MPLDYFDISSLATYRRCIFVVRSDFVSKPGGDVDLAHQLSREAAAHGARVEIVPASEVRGVATDDLLFLFNIDRPYDAYLAVSRAPRGTRALLYTLHHPHGGITRYLNSGLGGIKGMLATLAGRIPDRYEAILDLVKGLRHFDARRLASGFRRGNHIRHLLARCEALVVKQAELDTIEGFYGLVTRGAALLPHPVAPFAARVSLKGLRYVLVPGRIEPRKNQLAVLKALVACNIRERGLEIVVIGGKGSDSTYFSSVVNFCLANRIIYLSQLTKDLFFPAVSSAELVINGSYFEVTSLIDLYAIKHGIPLVTTRFGYYEPTALLAQVDPDAWANDRKAIAAAIDEVLQPA